MLTAYLAGARARHVPVNDVRLAVEVAGDGPAVLLLHGFPHTRAIWSEAAPLLTAAGLRVVAPDLRGLGDSDRAAGGYRATELAGDLAGVLDALGIDRAHVVGIDLGTAPAFALAATRPDRVTSLTLSEAMIGTLPGAESFTANGAPWWFGLHAVPGGFAEDLLEGREDRYIRFFLDSGSRRGLPEAMTARIVEAYRGRESLRAAFEHYRAMPANADWISSWVTRNVFTLPVLTIGGGAVGEATARQVAPYARDLTEILLPDAGHIVPVDAPEEFAALVARHAKSAEARS
ncbi:alpha/beta fold hydrolase [Streptomyces fumanus]|uniref:Hydrolase n=1 Tax=Streptomyces fumanus TaxID=67302 RepID=A0A919A8Z1_9ACTN|nr:alpha/beta hydrolase [Streptomyces fumanus]GHE92322.1 hydrolase [Streptomyces fumanus]